MADRRSLGFVGFIFGAVTAAVILMAATVVMSHIGAGGALDTAAIAAPMVSAY